MVVIGIAGDDDDDDFDGNDDEVWLGREISA